MKQVFQFQDMLDPENVMTVRCGFSLSLQKRSLTGINSSAPTELNKTPLDSDSGVGPGREMGHVSHTAILPH